MAFLGSNNDKARRNLIMYLSAQDIHAQTDGSGLVMIAREQWQTFVDYFRPNPVLVKATIGLSARRSGQKMELGEILDFIHSAGNRHIVITGGEPTLWNLDPIISAVRATLRYSFIELETSGQYMLKGEQVPDFITWSPKSNLRFDALPEFKRHVHQVKWVVDNALDIDIVQKTWAWFTINRGSHMPTFMMMPEGCPPSDENIQRALDFARRSPPAASWFVGPRLQYYYNMR
jgi:organic radical activating enzyme